MKSRGAGREGAGEHPGDDKEGMERGKRGSGEEGR